VYTATGLSSSIGIAPNKPLAKIASDLDKPDGLTLVTLADLPERIWPLPPRKINGIGPKAAAKLESLGIRSIGELAHADPAWLVEQFGRHYGAWMHEVAHGATTAVVPSEPSISRETTLDRDSPPHATGTAQRDHRPLPTSPTACGGPAMPAAQSDSSCATTTSRPSRDQTLDAPTQDGQ
jgi:DNA polymerase-4